MKAHERTGRLKLCSVGGERYHAFIPARLPPDPTIDLNQQIQYLLGEANRAVGRLDGIALILPDIHLFIWLYIRKEALLSSQIEGTQSSLSDLLLHENKLTPGVPEDDVREVSNYIAAMEHGLERLKEFPLSLRLIREIHAKLLQNARGGLKNPGEFRRSQNWIGGPRPGQAAFVPPPPEHLDACLDNFEKFLHSDETPTLIKAALAHAQFETIHPFLDGNGRLGRLLITFLLCNEKALAAPILYLSLYFKKNRSEYYDRLQQIRTHGDWEGWLTFFLQGVIATANQAVDSAREVLFLFDRNKELITERAGRSANSALRLHEALKRHPLTDAASLAEATKLSKPTIHSALDNLQELGVINEVTGKQRGRIYLYHEYLAILQAGTEPINSHG